MKRQRPLILWVFNYMEVWKDIKDYEGIYQISSLGNVKSLKRFSIHPVYGEFFIKEKILKAKLNKRGYFIVCLHKNYKQKTFLVSRLVAISFLNNPLNKPQVNHIDGIKTNNFVNNLEWNTNLENQIHAYKTGLKIGLRGEKNHLSKLKINDILEIRNSSLTHRKLAQIYNVAHSCIGSIKRNQTWKYEK